MSKESSLKNKTYMGLLFRWSLWEGVDNKRERINDEMGCSGKSKNMNKKSLLKNKTYIELFSRWSSWERVDNEREGVDDKMRCSRW